MRSEDEHEYVDYVSARLPRLHRAAFLLCGDAHRADDIVQSTVTALYRHWGRARGADNMDAYVHRMLVRQYLDEKRLGWSKVMLGWAMPDRPAREGIALEDQETVHTALRQLPRGQRAVLVLRFLCDMSIEDTAATLRCSTGNVKAQTARALEAMRKHLVPSSAPAGTGSES